MPSPATKPLPRAPRLGTATADTTIPKDGTVSVGYIRFAQRTAPVGQPIAAAAGHVPTPGPASPPRELRSGCIHCTGGTERTAGSGDTRGGSHATGASHAEPAGMPDLAQTQRGEIEVVLNRAIGRVGYVTAAAHSAFARRICGKRFLLEAAVDAALAHLVALVHVGRSPQHVDALTILFENPVGDFALERRLRRASSSQQGDAGLERPDADAGFAFARRLVSVTPSHSISGPSVRP